MVKFGTSGFRGIIAENFTKDNIQKLAYALAQINETKLHCKKATIGFDNRFMSATFAKWFLEAFYSKNIDVYFYSQSVPSPLISFESQNSIGIMITASHNPFEYNGIKIFINQREIDNEIANELENLANIENKSNFTTTDFIEIEKSSNFHYTTNIDNYCNNILNLVNVDSINKKLKVCYNNMFGSALNCVKNIFEKLSLNCYILNGNLDPYFAYRLPCPYKENLKEQVDFILENNFDIGFAVDGDGDRFCAIDKNGKLFDCNYIMAILYYYLLKYKNYSGNIILDVATTTLIKKVAEHFGYDAIYSIHGFKNIGENILKNNAFMGGESNGIAFKKHLLSKDGIVLIPLILEILSQTKLGLTELVNQLETQLNYTSFIIEQNFTVTIKEHEELNKKIFKDKFIPKISENIKEISYFDGLKIIFENDYWLCIRFSGNEPVIRLFVEESSQEKAKEILEQVIKALNLQTPQQ